MKFIFLGDFFVSRDCIKLIPEEFNHDVKKLIAQHDVCICNLEAPVKAETVWLSPKIFGPPLSQPFESLQYLSSLGITHASIYNNHIADYSSISIQYTVDLLSKVNIKPLSRVSSFTDKSGKRINIYNSGMLEEGAHYTMLNKYGAHFMYDAFHSSLSNSNINIAYTHFGAEMLSKPSYAESFFLENFSRNFDLVLKHHPHVPQMPIKYNDSYVFPSLGDFLFYKKKELAPRTSGLIVSFDSDENKVEYYAQSIDKYGLVRIKHNSKYHSQIDCCLNEEICMLYSSISKSLPITARFLVKFLALSFIFGSEVTDRLRSRISAHSFEPFLDLEIKYQ